MSYSTWKVYYKNVVLNPDNFSEDQRSMVISANETAAAARAQAAVEETKTDPHFWVGAGMTNYSVQGSSWKQVVFYSTPDVCIMNPLYIK